jgi:hypothetical protein
MLEFISYFLLGLTQKEVSIVLLFSHQYTAKKYGEIPGSNLRNILNLTKEQLFLELEKLVQKNVLKFSSHLVEDNVCISAGKGYYVFNANPTTWTPSAESYFYKVCKLKGYSFNSHSYQLLLSELDFREELSSTKKEKDDDLVTPYEAFDWFCGLHKKTFGREYYPINQVRDFANLKKLLFEMSYLGYTKANMRDFFQWCFLSKVRDFKSAFIVGFLPMCFEDYRSMVRVDITKRGFVVDEDGRMRKTNTGESSENK